jgi:hypothetical protein
MSHLHTLEQARAAKARVFEVFRQFADVVGVGVTRIDGGYAVKVNLRSTPEPGILLPDMVDDVPVRVEIVGSIGEQ